MQQVVAMPRVQGRSEPVLAVVPATGGLTGSEDALLTGGVLEEVCGELARFATLRVISWASAQAVTELADAEIAARLGATHVLRGGVRRLGDRIRVRVGLVDCAEAIQIWSERFETGGDELFTVQDEVVGRIATTLVARLEDAAVRAALRRPAASLAAYELTLRGLAELRRGTHETDLGARALFDQALEIDPGYARAHAGLSLSYFNEWTCQYWDMFRENGRLAYAHAHRALELDDRDAMVHLVIGRIQLYRRQFDLASWYFDRALALCPNDAELLVQLSICEVFMGRPDVALGHVRRAMALNPYHPQFYHGFAGFAHLGLREFDQALDELARAGPIPVLDLPAYVAIALAHQGRMAEAREHFARYGDEFRRLITFGREPEPGESVRWLLDVNPYRREEDVAFLLDGLRRLDAARPVPEPTRPPQPHEAARFARQGAGWVLAFDGREILMPALKGLVDIQRLLSNPGEEVHCLDLAERAEESFGADPVLDDKARHALKARARDLQEEIAEAEDRNDIGRAERLRAEFDTLVETLSRALGIGGRSRRLGSLAERARTTVTWRIRHAARRIEAAHPELGRHFAHSLRTGTFCSYSPEHAVAWRLASEPA
jgi:TolB-like protein/Tfp pilus assembly protein PilF